MVGVNHDIMVCFFDILSDAFRSQVKAGRIGILVRREEIFLRFNMAELYLKVLKNDMFEVPGVGFVDADTVTKVLRAQFKVRVKKGSICGRPMTVYDVSADEIREKTGVLFVL